MNNIKELLQHIQDEENRIKKESETLAEQKAQLRVQTLAQVMEAISTFGFTAEELGIKVKAVKEAEPKKAPKEKRVIPPKYRTADGIEWTGRGIMPKAMKAWLDANGLSKEDIKI